MNNTTAFAQVMVGSCTGDMPLPVSVSTKITAAIWRELTGKRGYHMPWLGLELIKSRSFFSDTPDIPSKQVFWWYHA